ncbi:MAG: hypothetical protein QM229_03105 [Bacillota bacterium]|nr:hypothetical protein [Bacillota bacterium]
MIGQYHLVGAWSQVGHFDSNKIICIGIALIMVVSAQIRGVERVIGITEEEDRAFL